MTEVLGGAQQASVFRFSTAALPARDRVTITRDLLGRKIARLEIDPLEDQPFRLEYDMRMVADLAIVSAVGSPLRTARTRELLSDCDDSLAVQVAHGYGEVRQLGREAVLTPGDAVVMSNADPRVCHLRGATNLLGLRLPRAALAPLLRDSSAALVRTVPKDTAALRLLIQYVELTRKEAALGPPDLQHIFARHVYDLLSLALGATRDAAEAARGGGLRAARLRALKADIQAHLADESLAIGTVARRQGISASYIRRLFESEDTTFSEFVLNERLVRAYRLLNDPLFERRVSSVAFEVGFGDLSYFNRTFRRRFAATPSDIRAARSSTDAG